jgi:acetate kinase
MKVLVINCGSSSIKYQLYDIDSGQSLAKGIVARIGEQSSYLEYQAKGEKLRKELPIPSHGKGFELVVQSLLDKEHGVLEVISEVSAVGHRTVHGGDTFTESVLITEEVIRKIDECVPLAPLHNPANLLGIREAMRILPDIPHVAVFDTAFHQSMPPKAYLYALPYQYYQEHKIRKYGFHGSSCRFVVREAAELMGKSLDQVKMIVCHLGNGVTLVAVKGGQSIDTSMGLTPLEGLMMGTRSGDIDPGVIFFISRQMGLSIDQIDDLLNRESGLLGVSGISNDMREITAEANLGNDRCKLTIEMYTYRVKKYIGAYAAALGGPDALVFTAGIGENSSLIRRMICEGLEFLGIQIDEKRNEEAIGVKQIISKPNSLINIIVVPTNEEQVIVEDTITVAGLSVKDQLRIS